MARETIQCNGTPFSRTVLQVVSRQAPQWRWSGANLREWKHGSLLLANLLSGPVSESSCLLREQEPSTLTTTEPFTTEHIWSVPIHRLRMCQVQMTSDSTERA